MGFLLLARFKRVYQDVMSFLNILVSVSTIPDHPCTGRMVYYPRD